MVEPSRLVTVVTFVREQHDPGPEHFATVLGGVTLELYPASSTRPPEAGLRIGLKVEDVDVVVKSLAAAGHPKREGGGLSFLDPDGRIVALSDGRDDDG